MNNTIATTIEGTYKVAKTNNNTITCVIEETYNDGEYSVLIFDDYSSSEGGIWVEKFAKTYNEATQIADRLFSKYTK